MLLYICDLWSSSNEERSERQGHLFANLMERRLAALSGFLSGELHARRIPCLAVVVCSDIFPVYPLGPHAAFPPPLHSHTPQHNQKEAHFFAKITVTLQEPGDGKCWGGETWFLPLLSWPAFSPSPRRELEEARSMGSMTSSDIPCPLCRRKVSSFYLKIGPAVRPSSEEERAVRGGQCSLLGIAQSWMACSPAPQSGCPSGDWGLTGYSPCSRITPLSMVDATLRDEALWPGDLFAFALFASHATSMIAKRDLFTKQK